MLRDKIVIVDITKKQKLVSEVTPLSSRNSTMTKSNSSDRAPLARYI